MAPQKVAGQQGRDARPESPVSRLTTAEATAMTAANLYSLMTWLYEKPRS